MLPWKCRTNTRMFKGRNISLITIILCKISGKLQCSYLILLMKIFQITNDINIVRTSTFILKIITYLWILLINPTAHRSSGMVVWPTSKVPWCSARQITLLGFPVPLGTAPFGIRFLPCPPMMCRHLKVEEVASWPLYLDFVEA